MARPKKYDHNLVVEMLKRGLDKAFRLYYNEGINLKEI